MDIIIQSLGFTAGEGLESFVREKLEKFNSNQKVIRADVTLYMGPNSAPERYWCEVRLEIPGNDAFVKKNADSFEKAIVSAADALQRSMKKVKEKLIQRHQAGRTEKA